MRFQVTLDRDEDGVWVVECPSIPGCVSQGATREEALKNIEEAIALCLEVRALSRGHGNAGVDAVGPGGPCGLAKWSDSQVLGAFS